MTDADELAHRLTALRTGPWTPAARAAAAAAAPGAARGKIHFQVEALGGARDPLVLSLVSEDQKTHLAPHWKATPSPEADAFRADLDAQLDDLALLELAIETGYLPAAAGDEARDRLGRLAASAAVREYIEDYDFIPVLYLAGRLGVEGLRRLDPPAPDPTAAPRFAAFLAGHADWLRDENLREWQRFLDDFVVRTGEQDLYYDYLADGRVPAKADRERFARLTAGLQHFVAALADLFGLLEPGEGPRFGIFYGYWLAKFFGDDLGPKGYQPNRLIWEPGDSWAVVARSSPVFRPAGSEWTADIPGDVPVRVSAGDSPAQGAWQTDIDRIASAWVETKAFVAGLAATSDKSPKATGRSQPGRPSPPAGP